MTPAAAAAAYRLAFLAAGAVAVTVQRVSGYAPNVTTVSAVTVAAIVRQVARDGASTRQAGLSALTTGVIDQDERLVIVLADDLSAAGFPLPLAKGDQIVLPDSAEILNITRVDPYKRALAGAIELYASGVS